MEAGRLHLGADSGVLVISALPGGAPAPAPMVTVQTLRRATVDGRAVLISTGTQQQQQVAGTRTMKLTILDTIVVDAADFTLRRSHSLILDDEGRALSDVESTLRGAAIVRVVTRSDAPDTARIALASAAEFPIGLPYHRIRASALTTGERFRMPLIVPGDTAVTWMEVDSVRTAGRDWLVHARLKRARVSLTIDTLSRDLRTLVVESDAGVRMTGTYGRRADETVPQRPATAPSPAEVRAHAGVYALSGVREAASELRLREDGSFTFGLTYGALDESGSGRWTVDGGTIVLQSSGTAHPPKITLQSARGTARDSIVVLVHAPDGKALRGVEVDVVRPGAGTTFGRTTGKGYVARFDPASPPVELGIGYDIANFIVPFPLSRPPRAEYVFRFDRGDLGTRRFEGVRATRTATGLTLPLNGRPLSYVRR